MDLTPNPMPSIPALSDDVLLLIFKILIKHPARYLSPLDFLDDNHDPHYAIDEDSLSSRHSRQLFVTSVPLVSRAWHVISRRALYQYVELASLSSFAAYKNAVERQPTIGRLTTSLVVTCPLLNSEDNDGRRDIAKQGAAATSIRADANDPDDKCNGPVAPGVQLDAASEAYVEDTPSKYGVEYTSLFCTHGIWDRSFFELLPLLPNLKHFCMKKGKRFALQHHHMSYFPADLDLLCLHGFFTSMIALPALPSKLRRVIFNHCAISSLHETLRLPELRCLKWKGIGKYSELEADSFEGCPKLERLSITVRRPVDAFNKALAPLLPRLKHLEIDSLGFSRVSEIFLADCFKALSGLQHLKVSDYIASEDIPFLPPSIRTFTWEDAGRGGMESLWSLCRLLRESDTLPNLVTMPNITCSPIFNDFQGDKEGQALRRDAFNYMLEKRKLPCVGGSSEYSLWYKCA